MVPHLKKLSRTVCIMLVSVSTNKHSLLCSPKQRYPLRGCGANRKSGSLLQANLKYLGGNNCRRADAVGSLLVAHRVACVGVLQRFSGRVGERKWAFIFRI